MFLVTSHKIYCNDTALEIYLEAALNSETHLLVDDRLQYN